MTEHNLTVIVSDDVYDDLVKAHQAGDMPLGRPKKLVPTMSKAKLKVGAAWIKANAIRYGVGYWNGFATEAKPSIVLRLDNPASIPINNASEVEAETEPVATEVVPPPPSIPKAPPIPAPTE